MWTTIAITAAALALVGGMIFVLVRVYARAKVGEVERKIAQGEAERRAKDAEIAARPSVDRPLGRMRPK